MTFIRQNEKTIESIKLSANRLQKTFQGLLTKLKNTFDEKIKVLNDSMKIYQK